MNEADTRAEFIDKQLAAAGWSTGGDVRVQREYNINAGEIKAGGIPQPVCGFYNSAHSPQPACLCECHPL